MTEDYSQSHLLPQQSSDMKSCTEKKKKKIYIYLQASILSFPVGALIL